MENIDRIKYLYETYKNRNITHTELDDLLSLIKNDKEAEDRLVRMIEQDLLDNNISEDPIIHRIIKKSEANIISRTTNGNNIRKINVLRYAIAASMIILLSVSVLYFYKGYQNYTDSTQNSVGYMEDVEAGGNRATLKISDGRSFSLDSTNHQISTKGDAILLNDGYKIGDLSEAIVSLQLSTPRKGNYQAVLPDGTKVWLNAESTIDYPSRFTANDRVIKVSGEVYLEVAKVNNSKFIVELSGGKRIEVLGTKFNINAFPDQHYIKTSLLEGKVRVVNQYSKAATLAPGQKAVIHASANSIIVSHTKLDNDLAWLNHKFNFEDLTFEEIMQQIARWYDVDVIYKSRIPNVEFYGELNKNNSLKYLVDVFKQSDIHMEIKNRTLIVE